MKKVLIYIPPDGTSTGGQILTTILFNTNDISSLSFITTRLEDTIKNGDIFYYQQVNSIPVNTRRQNYVNLIKSGIIARDSKKLSLANKMILNDDSYYNQIFNIDFVDIPTTDYIAIHKVYNEGKILPIDEISNFYIRDINDEKIYIREDYYNKLIKMGYNFVNPGRVKAVDLNLQTIYEDYKDSLFSRFINLLELYDTIPNVRFIKLENYVNSLFSLNKELKYDEYKYIRNLLSNSNSRSIGIELLTSINFSKADINTLFYYKMLCTHLVTDGDLRSFILYENNNSISINTIPSVYTNQFDFSYNELINLVITGNIKGDIKDSTHITELNLINISEYIKYYIESHRNNIKIDKTNLGISASLSIFISNDDLFKMFDVFRKSQNGLEYITEEQLSKRFQYLSDNLLNMYNFI